MPHSRKKCLAVSGLFFESVAEPGARVLPIPVGHGPRHPQRGTGLLDREPAEQVEVSDLGRGRVFIAESGQQLVQRQDEVGVLGEGTGLIEQFESNASPAAFEPLPIAGVVDRDPRIFPAAVAKKCPRPSKCWSPRRRRYASWTRAVGLRLWPGASAARRADGGAGATRRRRGKGGGLARSAASGWHFEYSGNVGHSASVTGTVGSGMGKWSRGTLPKNPLRAPVTSAAASSLVQLLRRCGPKHLSKLYTSSTEIGRTQLGM